MKKRLLTCLLALAMTLALTFGLSACIFPPRDRGGKVQLNQQTLNLAEGGTTGMVSATINGGSKTDYVTWTISDSAVASISPMNNLCIVNPLKQGTAILTATFGEDQATCTVTVGPPVVVETVTIFKGEEDVSGKTIDLNENDEVTLTATASKGSEINWSSDKPDVASVDGGKVTAHRPGKATISAFVTGSIRATVTVNVKAPEGTVFYDLQFGNGGQPVTEPPAEGGEGTPIPTGQFYYWSARSEWSQQQVDVEHAYFRDGTVNIKYTSDWSGAEDPNVNGGYFYGFQLYCCNPDLTIGTYYKFTCKITVDQDCTFNVNGNLVDLKQGDNDVTIYYQVSSDKNFSLYTGYDMMDGTNGYFVQNVDFSIGNMQWTPDTRVQLQAPSFTVGENNVITINDPNKEGVGSYRLDFYNEQSTRIASVSVKSGEAIDTRRVINGTYTVKLVAQALNAHYIDSPESSVSATVTVSNESMQYDLEPLGVGGAVATPGIWTYYKSTWVEIREASYQDGVVTFSFANNQGNWDDTQLYYRAPQAEDGKYYNFTLKITANAGGHIIISGNTVEIVEGTKTYELGATQAAGGATIAFVFALPGQANAQEIKEGAFTIELLSIEEGEAPAPAPEEGDFVFGGNGVGGEVLTTPDRLYYWNNQGWIMGNRVNVTEHSYENGVYTLTYDGVVDTVYQGMQLFYKHSGLVVGQRYTVSFKLNASVAGDITVNGQVVSLKAGDNTVTVTYTEPEPGQYEGASLSIQFGVLKDGATGEDFSAKSVIAAGTFKLSELKFTDSEGKEVEPGAQQKPVEPADPNDYTLGEKVTPSYDKMKEGGEFTDGKEGSQGTDNNPDTWIYWYVQDTGWNCGTVVTLTKQFSNANGQINFAYKGGSMDFSVQLFYKSTSLTAGKPYFLSLKIDASADITVGINGVKYPLTKGENDVRVVFVLNGEAAISAVDFQFPGNASEVEFTVSDVAWQEITEGYVDPNQPTPTTGFLSGGDTDSVKHPGAMYYWNDHPDWCGTDVRITTEPYKGDGVYSFTYSGMTNTCWFGLQLFLKNVGNVAGQTYTLSFKLNASVAGNITVNGQTKTLTVGDNAIEVTYTETDNVPSLSIQFGVKDPDGGASNAAQSVIPGGTFTLSGIAFTQQGGGGATQPDQPTQPDVDTSDARQITVTSTEFYADNFVKIGMSEDDLNFLKANADHVTTNGVQQPHNGDKGFLVDGNVIQVQFNAGETQFKCIWYNAQNEVIAVCTFTKA